MPLPRHQARAVQDHIVFTKEHGSTTATGSIKLYQAPAGRGFRLTRALYINPTGLAIDATNAFRGEIKNGSVVMAALFNTDTDDVPAGVAIPANTFVEGVITAANAVLAPGQTLDITFTEDGTATLPAGTILIEGRLL